MLINNLYAIYTPSLASKIKKVFLFNCLGFLRLFTFFFWKVSLKMAKYVQKDTENL